MLATVFRLGYLVVWVTAFAVASTSSVVEHPTPGTQSDTDHTHEVRQLGRTCTLIPAFEGDDACKGRENDPRFKKCLQPCQFTLDWFIENKKTAPKINECLFYTANMSDEARDYAQRWNMNHKNKLVTIWDLWNDWLYKGEQTIDNPMRCIIQQDIGGTRNEVRTGYFKAMSNAMAYMCGGTAVVMEKNMTKGVRQPEIKRDGIWGQVELPRLQMPGPNKWLDPDTGRRRVCNRVDVIGPDQPVAHQYFWIRWWTRGGPDWPAVPRPPDKKRAVKHNAPRESGGVRIVENKRTANRTSGETHPSRGTSLEKREVDVSVFDDPDGPWYVHW